MSDVVQKQVKAQLDRLVKEVKEASGGVSSGTKKVAESLTNAATNISTLTSETVRYSEKSGAALTSVRKGYTDVGKAITEVWKNGRIVSGSVVETDEISRANILYREQSGLIKELYSVKTKLVSETDAGTVAGLKEQEKALQEIIDKNRDVVAGFDQQIIKQSSLVKLAEEEKRLKEKYLFAQTSQTNAASDGWLKKTKEAYKSLTEAYTSYQNAVKRGDGDSADYWKSAITSTEEVIRNIEKQVSV